jgi:hypothetical protein
MKNHVTENGSVTYVRGEEYINLKCTGFFSYEEVVSITEYTCEMLRFYNLNKCIINLKQVKVYPSGAEEYLRDIWYKKLIEMGVSRIAFVVPYDIFGNASMKVVHAGDAVQKIQRQYFTDESPAKEWLKS